MPKPKTPSDLYVVNGWWLEMPGLMSPHFETLEGAGINTDSVSIVDAGANIKYKFSGQILDFTDLTLTRTQDGSSDDAAVDALYDQCVRLGFKFNCALVMTHNGQEVYRIAFVGFRFVNKTLPTLDINAAEKLTVTYTATNDYWFLA